MKDTKLQETNDKKQMPSKTQISRNKEQEVPKDRFSWVLVFVTCLALGTCLFYFLPPLYAAAKAPLKATCPVMPGERVKEKFYVDHAGERIYLCCRNCVKAFKRNPSKYI